MRIQKINKAAVFGLKWYISAILVVARVELGKPKF